MGISLSDMKLALRIDTDEDDNLLNLFMSAASDTVKNAVGREVEGFFDNNPIYDVTVMRLVDHYYKNRSATSNGQHVFDIPFGVTPSILQLKGSYLCQLQKQGT
ncbi:MULTISPECIES: head-tail connector protein [Bacillus subtilis group]|uniref:head-tail connector protein n=1 Tax=Bacillus velezensis TaxID=492670 RepID=UPI000CF94D66|nr:MULTISPECIES: head-tail connector protein [Bacillus subtilis group]AVI29857.1 hypothetical protein C3Z10_16400 [Bacillus velezensis]AYK64163.1 hypothetical protein D9C11_00550 [Bacillus subtilis subsp. subtilis]UBM44967.1 head-tail connector protein [Bacillus velezensis]